MKQLVIIIYTCFIENNYDEILIPLTFHLVKLHHNYTFIKNTMYNQIQFGILQVVQNTYSNMDMTECILKCSIESNCTHVTITTNECTTHADVLDNIALIQSCPGATVVAKYYIDLRHYRLHHNVSSLEVRRVYA